MFQQQQLAQQQTNAILQHLINVNQINNNISSKTSVLLASTTAMNFQPPLEVPLPVKDYPVIDLFNSSKKHNNSMHQESTSFQYSSTEIVDDNEECRLFNVTPIEVTNNETRIGVTNKETPISTTNDTTGDQSSTVVCTSCSSMEL